MTFRLGTPEETTRANMSRTDAKNAGEQLRQHATEVVAIREIGGFVLRATFTDRTIRYFRTVEDVQQLQEKASVAWMLANGPAIMLGKE
jgi:hypothetical protein